MFEEAGITNIWVSDGRFNFSYVKRIVVDIDTASHSRCTRRLGPEDNI
jgi:hypothetical protein